MRSRENKMGDSRSWLKAGFSVLAALVVVATVATNAACAEEIAPKHFAAPEDAVKALVDALRAHDQKALLEIFGSSGDKLISSGDEVADHKASEDFVAKYDKANSLAKSGDGEAILQVGRDEWPFPIPLKKSAAGWSFDAAAGKEELLDRRIGRNELDAMNACLAFVDAQREYYSLNPEHDKLHHYAQFFASSPGKRDGLYWDTEAGEDESPLGASFARARAQGYKGKHGQAEPFHGYYYRILTAQGANAAGGAYDYLAHGKMIGGFALVAYPAEYGNSGVMTFVVNQDGVLFEKDLGPSTARASQAIKTFNPDSTWKRAEVQAAN